MKEDDEGGGASTQYQGKDGYVTGRIKLNWKKEKQETAFTRTDDIRHDENDHPTERKPYVYCAYGED